MAVVDEVDGTMVEPMANSSSSLEEVLGGIGCDEENSLTMPSSDAEIE